MKFDTPATTNPIDQLKVIGKPTDRIDGPLKTTGTAPYAYERHDVVPNQAYGVVIGSMTMGAGAALMEELVVDKRLGYFVNHDMAEYAVPVHADIPAQEVVFLDELDDKSSPMKAKGVGELGICGAGAAVANAIYNACGVRVRDYPLTLDKIIEAPSSAPASLRR